MSKVSKKSKFSDLKDKLMLRGQNTLKNEIHVATNNLFSDCVGFYYNTDIFKEFNDINTLNEKENLNLTLKKLGKKEKPLKITGDFSCSITRAYLDYIDHKVCVELLDYAMCRDVPLLVIKNEFNLKALKINCMSYQSNYDFTEILNDYQPAKIIFLQPQRYNGFSECYILGVYLLDEENNFISKFIIQFMDEKNAPKGCKKLRVPKTVSEFYDSY